MELRVSSYGSRADLEAYCERLEPEQKTGLVIVGTADEFARFQLSQSTTVYGVPCECTEPKVIPVVSTERPTRIVGDSYGLNGNNLTKLDK